MRDIWWFIHLLGDTLSFVLLGGHIGVHLLVGDIWGSCFCEGHIMVPPLIKNIFGYMSGLQPVCGTYDIGYVFQMVSFLQNCFISFNFNPCLTISYVYIEGFISFWF